MLRCELHCNGALGLVPALWALQPRPCSSSYHWKPEHRGNGEAWAESNMSIRELRQQPRDWNRTMSNLERLVHYKRAELLLSNILEWHYSPACFNKVTHGIFKQLQMKNIGEMIPENSKKHNLNLPSWGNYLHSVYIIFTTIYIVSISY